LESISFGELSLNTFVRDCFKLGKSSTFYLGEYSRHRGYVVGLGISIELSLVLSIKTLS